MNYVKFHKIKLHTHTHTMHTYIHTYIGYILHQLNPYVTDLMETLIFWL